MSKGRLRKGLAGILAVVVIAAIFMSLNSPVARGVATMRLQYQAYDANPTNDIGRPWFRLYNDGGSAVTLSTIKIRYWFTKDNATGFVSACDWASAGCANITRTFYDTTPVTGADKYLELVFTSGAGSLGAGQYSEIELQYYKSDWSTFTESNDYSFDATKTAFADWTKVTVYENGALIWGTEPGGGGGPTNTPLPPTNTPTKTNTPVGPTNTPVPPSNTGWVSPAANAAATGGDGNGFQTNPTNAYSDNATFAVDTDSGNNTNTTCSNTGKDKHVFYTYNLSSVPSGATIVGIEVQLQMKVDSTSGSPKSCIELSWNGGTNWTAAKTSSTFTTSEASYTLGGAADTWGHTWTVAELSNFRVRITNVASNTSRDFSLDWIPVRVSYTGGGPTNTPVPPTNTPTKTNTPVGPTNTPTRTPTPTNTPVGPTNTPLPPSGSKIVGYFAQWGVYARNYHIKNIVTSGSASKLTHINYAFANVSNGQCVIGDSYADYDRAYDAASSVSGVADCWDPGCRRGSFHQLEELKALYPNVKVLLSVGGWTWSGGFTQAAANPTAFADSCYNLVHDSRWNGTFDGIDIDWEYPNACGLSCDTSGPNAFKTLMQALRNRFGSELVTAAVPAGYDKINVTDYGGASQYVDWYNIMSYDFFGAWATTGPTAYQSALYTWAQIPTANYYADYAVQLYKGQGVPASKLVLGVPFYGRGWTGVGSANNGLGQSATGPATGTYEAGIEDYKVLKNVSGTVYYGAGTLHKYGSSVFWSYDDPTSLATKQTYRKNQGMSGVMFWELSGDTTGGELITALYNNR